MRLEYKILWIENDDGWLKTTKEFVEDVIEDNGFVPRIQDFATEKDIESLLKDEEPFKEYDLILVDFNLDEGDNGRTIIKNIRDHNIFTEIMFYSQDIQGIRREVGQYELDGVYCSSRDRPIFEDKFEKIFKVTVKKIQHISTMRGLVMAETSELDSKLLDIISTYHSLQQNNICKELYDYKLEKIDDSLSKNLKNLSKYKEKPDLKILTDFIFDSYKKMKATGKILEILKIKDPIDKARFITEYEKEVIGIRNNLAHASEKKVNGKSVLVTKKGTQGYSAEECIKIRKDLKKHFEYLDKIKALLKTK